jgi:arginyl-tRNA synthetase
MAGVKCDHVFLERTLYQRDLVTSVLSDFKTRDMLYDAEQSEGDEEKVRREESKASKYAHQQLGGTFLKTKQFGDEEDRIVLRKSGEPVYLLADLAYHQDKYARGFDWMIDVFGADHANHTLRLRAGMSALGLDPKKLDFVVVQIVHLLRDGQEIRFSKRSGEIYLLEDLIEEMGSDVVRFIFLMRAGNTQFDFDLDLALKASNDNPVFYVQYGHARMATLLKRAAEAGKTLDAAEGLRHLDRLILPEERNMLKIMGSFPDVVLAAAKGLEPHRILYFCQELIGEFHGYFTKYRQSERIISDDADLTQSRLALVAALKQTLYNALSLLGISAPEYMQPGQEKVDDS